MCVYRYMQICVHVCVCVCVRELPPATRPDGLPLVNAAAAGTEQAGIIAQR